MDIKEAAVFIATEVAEGRDGSYSFNYEEPKTGFFVGGRSWTLVTRPDVFDPYTALDFLEAHRTVLSHKAVFVGWWTHQGKVYLDVTDRFRSRQNAIAEGKARGEIAIWDIERKEEINV